MELEHAFSVEVPIEEAWTVLKDLERAAACMPGLELQEVDGDRYRGVVKVKVGPVVARYEGVASFQECDEARYRTVVRAEGRETRGQGHASATVTATLSPEHGGTHVALHTDLKISGKLAQFGRGVLMDVSNKLLDQFVRALEADVLSGTTSPGVGTEEAEALHPPASHVGPPVARDGVQAAPVSVPRRSDARSRDPIDLLAAAGPPVLKRIVPLVLVLAVVLCLLLCGRSGQV